MFVGAALQLHFARLASTLDADALKPIGHGACPCCGSPPVASAVVGWSGAHGTRFLFCALCGAAWNYIRIKCAACGSTKGITYYGFEGESDVVKAETCETCGAYLKVFQQHKVTDTEPLRRRPGDAGARPQAARGRVAAHRRQPSAQRVLSGDHRR